MAALAADQEQIPRLACSFPLPCRAMRLFPNLGHHLFFSTTTCPSSLGLWVLVRSPSVTLSHPFLCRSQSHSAFPWSFSASSMYGQHSQAPLLPWHWPSQFMTTNGNQCLPRALLIRNAIHLWSHDLSSVGTMSQRCCETGIFTMTPCHGKGNWEPNGLQLSTLLFSLSSPCMGPGATATPLVLIGSLSARKCSFVCRMLAPWKRLTTNCAYFSGKNAGR